MTTAAPANPDTDACARLLSQLHAHRRATDLSRTEVARRMGTTRSVVRRLEERTDRAGVQMYTVARYARAVGAELGYIVPLPDGPELRVMPRPVRGTRRTA